MMQPFRETAINFQRLSRYAATPQLFQKILAPSANKPIVLGTRRSTFYTKVERVVLNALAGSVESVVENTLIGQ